MEEGAVVAHTNPLLHNMMIELNVSTAVEDLMILLLKDIYLIVRKNKKKWLCVWDLQEEDDNYRMLYSINIY
jgi:hypothetical protein